MNEPTPPLVGLRVLDLSRLLPGPYGSMLLAQMGAEVVKIESPQEGDYLRTTPPFIEGESAHFWAVNRGKKSVALDLKHPQGRAAFLGLATTADAVLESFKPGTANRLGVGYAAVSAANPRIVYCSLSGYGQGGPYRERAGHDINYIALAGLLGLTGQRDGPPVPPAVQVADLGGGMMAALSILAGVLAARGTGQGRYIDVSMFDLVTSWVGAHAVPCYLAMGQVPGRNDLPLTGLVPCYQVYATRDGGYMSLGAIEIKFWEAFCRAAGRDDLIPHQYDPEATSWVRQLFLTRTRAEWEATLAGVDACCEPVLGLDEALAFAGARRAGLADGPMVMPLALGGDLPPPRLGQHTAELLREAGYSEAEIRDLVAMGAAGIDAPA